MKPMKPTRAMLPMLATLTLLPSQGSAETKRPPHIIFLMTDQHRADALGCAGNPVIRTPHIDALAVEGNLFTNAYSSCPSSTPARAGLLTGLSPWHHGMLGYGKVAESYEFEMPQMMRDLGYFTFGIGKMHWHPQYNAHGFHGMLLDESGRTESPGFMSDYRRWLLTQAPGEDPDKTGIGWNDHGAAVYALEERLHPTTWTGERAVELLRNYHREEPLFLKVSFARPHSPYDPPQRFLDLYADAEIPLPAHGAWSKEPGATVTDPKKHPEAAFGNFGDAYALNSRRHYYAAITMIDEQIGAIVETLKEKGMYENALICLVSDHGDMMGDHHHWRKTYAYEGSAAIPFVVKWPASLNRIVPTGSEVTQPVELRDVLPTFLAAGGGTVPEKMDGAPLTRLVTEQKPEWRRWIDLEHATCYTADNYWCALTDGTYKYIWFLHSGEEQLFDLAADPTESRNMIGEKRYRKRAEELRQAMAEHLRERGEEWVQDGKPVRREKTMIYSPNYPKK